MGTSGDSRDNRTWVVLELTRAGEALVEEGTLEGVLREHLRVDDDYPVFIPAQTYTRTHNVTIHLMQGYAFVSTGLPEVEYFNLEKDCPYVKQVLSSPGYSGLRVLSVIPDSSIQEMKDQLRSQIASDIDKGMQVKLTEGVYSALEGEVIAIEGSDAHVRIRLRSLDLIVQAPKIFLDPVVCPSEENPK